MEFGNDVFETLTGQAG